MPPLSPFTSNPFKTGDYDPEPARESIRGQVTLAVAFCFFAVIVFYLYQASRASTTWPQIKDAMQAVLPAVTSVLGTVLGFYFGSQKR